MLTVWEYFTVVVFNSLFYRSRSMESAARPFSTAILLDQQKTDIGSASSLINAVNTVFGSLGMMLGALNWSNFIEGLGIITAVCVTLAIAGWLALLHFKIRVEGL